MFVLSNINPLSFAQQRLTHSVLGTWNGPRVTVDLSLRLTTRIDTWVGIILGFSYFFARMKLIC
jgi:hypothetical protein